MSAVRTKLPLEGMLKPGNRRRAGGRTGGSVWHFIPAKFIFPYRPLRVLRIADPSGRAVVAIVSRTNGETIATPAAAPCCGLVSIPPETATSGSNRTREFDGS